MLYFLPGCTTCKNHREALLRLRDYMRSRGAKLARCCRRNQDALPDEGTLVVTCMQCHLIMSERRPGMRVMSLFEYVLEDPAFPWADLGGERITVQDCFRMRGNAPLLDAAREVLDRMNAQVVELPDNRDRTSFCGVWLNNPFEESCVAVAPRTYAELAQYQELLETEEQKARMEAWVDGYETERVLVYCNGCEKGLLLGGGHPVHMVELLARGLG